MKRATIHSRLCQITYAVYQSVLDLTPQQRRAALRELDRLTHTNCGWHLYVMRDALREFIRTATPVKRARAKREKGEGGK